MKPTSFQTSYIESAISSIYDGVSELLEVSLEMPRPLAQELHDYLVEVKRNSEKIQSLFDK